MTLSYFAELSGALRDHQQDIPCLLVDLDKLDANIDAIVKSIEGKKNLRIVSKSLPSISLLDYVLKRTGSQSIMDFHMPFLFHLTRVYQDNYDILLGKPMPQIAVRRLLEKCRKHHLPVHHIQWLADTQERLLQYLQIANDLDQPLRINLEVDIGLHRGGFATAEAFSRALEMISGNKEKLIFSGTMGYEPHVVRMPGVMGSVESFFQKTQSEYAEFLKAIARQVPGTDTATLTINGGGSPTFRLHIGQASAANEVSVGSAFLKPTDFDLPGLKDLQPACFIATPVLKKLNGINIPGMPSIGKNFGFKKYSYFIYGGKWMADFCHPADGTTNNLYGLSTNQCLFASNLLMEVDDYAFLRPHQSEFVLLQFGRILAYRNGKIEAVWELFDQ